MYSGIAVISQLRCVIDSNINNMIAFISVHFSSSIDI